MDKLKRSCKRLNIRLTVKKGSKRVYKSKQVLIKQIRRKLRHFGESKSEDKRSFYQKHKKKLKIAGGVALALAALGGAHYAATRTEKGKATFTGYNKRLGANGTWGSRTPKTTTEQLQTVTTEKELNKQIRANEDKRLLDDIQQANASNNISEKRALEDRQQQLQKTRLEEDRRTREEEDRLKQQKKLDDGEKITSLKNMQGLIFSGFLPRDQRDQVLSKDPMTSLMQGMLIDHFGPIVKNKVAEMLEGDKDIDELKKDYEKEQDEEKKQKILSKIEELEQEKKDNIKDIEEIAVLSEESRKIQEEFDNETDLKKKSKLNLKLNGLSQKHLKSQIKDLEKQNNEENESKIKDLNKKLEKFEKARLEIMEESGETIENIPDNEFGKSSKFKRRKKHYKLKQLLSDLKKLKNF